MRVLVTFPGKMGDLLYALPTVIGLKERLKCEVDLLTSPYCGPILPLLRELPYLGRVLTDETYRPSSDGFGLQPWQMSEPSGYDRVFHLGYRIELLGRRAYSVHLKRIPAIMLRRAYGVRVRVRTRDPFLGAARPEERATPPFYVFSGYGRSFLVDMPPEFRDRMDRLWRAIIPAIPMKGLVLTSEADRGFYDGLGLEVQCPADFLETARVMRRASFFLGGQTSCMAVAEGLGLPIAYFHWIKRVERRGRGVVVFGAMDSPERVLARIERRMVGRLGA
jgi:hypothetical protein